MNPQVRPWLGTNCFWGSKQTPDIDVGVARPNNKFLSHPTYFGRSARMALWVSKIKPSSNTLTKLSHVSWRGTTLIHTPQDIGKYAEFMTLRVHEVVFFKHA